jgi:hypothetical protein
MPVHYKKNLVVFDDVVSVEDAEDLLQWCQKNPRAKADFSTCLHLHAANLQVLLAWRSPHGRKTNPWRPGCTQPWTPEQLTGSKKQPWQKPYWSSMIRQRC